MNKSENKKEKVFTKEQVIDKLCEVLSNHGQPTLKDTEVIAELRAALS